MPDTILLLIIAVVAFALACRAWGQPRVMDRVTYWNAKVGGLDITADDFFKEVYQDLRSRVELQGVSLSGLDFGPKTLFENRSVFSQRPRYLCARYRHLTFYLYATPSPFGLYVSYSVYSKYVKGENESQIFTRGARKFFMRQTLFQYDAGIVFIESMKATVLAVIDRYTEEKGLKPLEEYERRPVYHAFYSSTLPPVPAPVVNPSALLSGHPFPDPVSVSQPVARQQGGTAANQSGAAVDNRTNAPGGAQPATAPAVSSVAASATTVGATA